jgi:hypothetical protein
MSLISLRFSPWLAQLLLLLGALALAACPGGRGGGGRGGGDDDDSAGGDDDTSDDDDTGDDDDTTPQDDDDTVPDDDDDSVPADGSLDTCSDSGSSSGGFNSTIGCGVDALVWDLFEIEVSAGDCVWISADNGSGAADLLAMASDANGDFYGMQPDFSQLDDETSCSQPPWDGDYGCPEASVVVENSGTFGIGVSQWGGDGCSDPASYTLRVAVNGANLSMGGFQVGDEQALGR